MKNSFKKTVSFVLAVTACANLFMSVSTIQPNEKNLITAFAEDSKVSADKNVIIDRTTLKAGNYLNITSADTYSLKYFISRVSEDGTLATEQVLPGDKGLLLTEDLYESWITVTGYNILGEETGTDRVYFSRLPVIYIDLDDGHDASEINKKEYLSGNLLLQDNERTDEPLYDGKITIKGRGNTTWGWPKKPYKIKLDKKTDFYGFGENKSWVLLANYLDESLLRNTTAAGLSEKLGLTTMQTKWVNLVMNGELVGNYQLCEQVGIAKDRVNIFDWEKEAEKAADAIADANGFKKAKKKDLESAMVDDLSWISTDSVTFEKKTYKVSDFYEYNRDLSGGYLFESSQEFDEDSKFVTNNGLYMMLKTPETLVTNDEMMAAAKKIWDDFEEAYRSEDGYNSNGDHYTDLADLDSMVNYWLLMEVLGNNDARYKSRYIYKDLGGKLTFGPPWDFDTGLGSSLVSTGETGMDMDPIGWKVSNYDGNGADGNPDGNPAQNFYKEFLDDPLFVAKATEKYWEIRPYLDELIREGGILDQNSEYLRESGNIDQILWNRSETWGAKKRGHETDSAMFKEFMRERIEWLDEQFDYDASLVADRATVESASTYKRSDKVSFEVSNGISNDDLSKGGADVFIRNGSSAEVKVSVTDKNIKDLSVYVNGKKLGNYKVKKGSTIVEIPADKLTSESGRKNVVSVIGKSANGKTTVRNLVTIAEKAFPEFTVNSVLLDGSIGLNVYMDLSALSDEEKSESYMEFKINGKTQKALFDASSVNDNDNYGFICNVSSVQLADEITSVIHYGDGKTIEKKFTLLDSIKAADNTITDKKALALIHAITDYGHFGQLWLASINNWTIGKKHAEISDHYTDSYNYAAIRKATDKYKAVRSNALSGISFSYSLTMGSKTDLNVYVNAVKTSNCKITVKQGNEIRDYKAVKQNDGRWLVKIPDIPADKLGEAYTISVTAGRDKNEFTVSPLSYVNASLSNITNLFNFKAKDAVSAFYKYYEAAVAYSK